MATLAITPLLSIAAFLGLLSHLLYFVRGEHHKQTLAIIQFYAVLFVVLVGLFTVYLEFPVAEATEAVSSLAGAYLFALYTSITIYRLFFHRLRHYPGPFSLKLSKLSHVIKIRNKDNHRHIARWHEQYGHYVRVGPAELSITDPDAVVNIYGPRSKCSKGPWYDISDPLNSMHQCRSRADHDKRRRAWDKGFNAKSLRDYEARVVGYADDLMTQLAAFSGRPLNAAEWFNYYSFDVMGDLAFGKPFGMLREGKMHFATELLKTAQGAFGLFSPAVWLFQILMRTPGVNSNYVAFVNWCNEQITKREQMKLEKEDITHWILQAPPMSSNETLNRWWLTGDARLIIVAGSDTTASTLTFMFYYLSTQPEHMQKLRDELKAANIRGDGTSNDLKDLPHLNGCINEALRLHPPVMSGLQRMTPPEGLQIGEHRIPGDICVFVPALVVGRDPNCYGRPNEFVPERWYSRPELVKRKDTFAPFSLGPYSCIGKHLALMELRTVTTKVLNRFNVTLAPYENGKSLLEGSKDIFTTDFGDLHLNFTPRA